MFTSKFIWDERKKKNNKGREGLFENGTLCELLRPNNLVSGFIKLNKNLKV